MKLNWGTGIAAFYISFVLFIGFMIYLTTTQNYDLVTENYYEQELKYQNTIDKRERANALEGNLQALIQEGNLQVLFPQRKGEIKGNITCFRPSDERKDFSEKVLTNEGSHLIPLQKFSKGKYLLKVEWDHNSEEYYKEITVVIP